MTKKEAQADPVFHLLQTSSKPLLVILKVYLSSQTQAGLKPYQKRKKKDPKIKSTFAKGSCLSFVAKGTGAAGALQVEKRK